MTDLPAIRTILAAYCSRRVHITEGQIEAAWAEYHLACERLREKEPK